MEDLRNRHKRTSQVMPRLRCLYLLSMFLLILAKKIVKDASRDLDDFQVNTHSSLQAALLVLESCDMLDE